jgi:hypothetical protein
MTRPLPRCRSGRHEGLTREQMTALGYPNCFDIFLAQQSLKRTLVPQDLVGPLVFRPSEESSAIPDRHS